MYMISVLIQILFRYLEQILASGLYQLHHSQLFEEMEWFGKETNEKFDILYFILMNTIMNYGK